MSGERDYDRRAEAWLKNRYPDASPDPGSVKFITDCAAYASGGWANIEVEWTESGAGRGEVLAEEAWQYDLSQLIRELLDIELPPLGDGRQG
jgi:hypothetical protein